MKAKGILVVDDSCMYQRLLSDVINGHAQLEVIGVASDGRQALDLIPRLQPDLVTLDILMPELDGIQTLMQICKLWPSMRTIMVSSLTSQGSEAALDALALGANEYVAKPSSAGGVVNIRQALGKDLLPKIEGLCGIAPPQQQLLNEVKSAVGRSSLQYEAKSRHSAPEIIAIGVSTGGPDALAKLLVQLPANLEVPIVIVQHMPAEFTAKLAGRLDAACALTVREAEMGDRLQAGTVYIAPGDYHMVLERVSGETVVRLNQNPHENSCRPAVDPLFRSVAALYSERCLGVILTGMGQDGLRGSEAIFTAGGSILVQDEASSIVWGMPKLVAMAGLADDQVPLNQMAIRILDRIRPVGATRSIRSDSRRSAANADSYAQTGSGSVQS